MLFPCNRSICPQWVQVIWVELQNDAVRNPVSKEDPSSLSTVDVQATMALAPVYRDVFRNTLYSFRHLLGLHSGEYFAVVEVL